MPDRDLYADPPVGDLVDAQLVERLQAEYCHRVDRLDIPGVVELFTDDGEYDFGFGRSYRGPTELSSLFSRVEAHRATSHHVSNFVTVIDGDLARSRCVLYAFHERLAGGEVHVWGQYHDEFRRTPQGWRISKKALRISHEKGTDVPPGLPTLYEPLPRGSVSK
ncbi:MAG: nuclear transport factor 2 family protein [Nostocoides sp.]